MHGRKEEGKKDMKSNKRNWREKKLRREKRSTEENRIASYMLKPRSKEILMLF